MLFTWFMLAGLILLCAPQALTCKFQFAFARIFRYPLSIGRNISLSARTHQPVAAALAQKQAQYQNYIANLEQELKQEREKVKALSGLRNRRPLEGANLVITDVITASIDSSRSELVINRGSDDGLAPGQFVLGDDSIIGAVADVSSRTARVKLITDPAFSVPVKIAKTPRLMRGLGGNLAQIKLLRHRVRTGEKIYVDKKPGFLGLPMITAKVTECTNNSENPLLWDVTAQPVCDVKKLASAAVIVMNP